MAGSAPDDDLEVGPWTIPGSELEWRFSTSGGPGGQHANRSNTRADLSFDLEASEAFPAEIRDRIIARLGDGSVVVSVADSRSQYRNRMKARARLREILETAAKPTKRRRATKPTVSSRRRRVEDKRARGEKKRMRQSPDWD